LSVWRLTGRTVANSSTVSFQWLAWTRHTADHRRSFHWVHWTSS